MNSNDWVAEHVMGFERQDCRSATRTSGECRWCHTSYGCAEMIGPCPKYPFPKFTLVDLMRKLGEKGDYVMVRYDALRTEHNFTVTLNMVRIADTDDPLQGLCDWLYRHQSLYPPKGKRFGTVAQVLEEYVPDYERYKGPFDDWPAQEEEPSTAVCANIRDAIKILQKAMGQ